MSISDLDLNESEKDVESNLVYDIRKNGIENGYILLNNNITKSVVETIWLQSELLKKDNNEALDLYINSPRWRCSNIIVHFRLY